MIEARNERKRRNNIKYDIRLFVLETII
jgi:hypothetical protein